VDCWPLGHDSPLSGPRSYYGSDRKARDPAACLQHRSTPRGSACFDVGMAEFNVAEAVALLTRAPATFDALLRGLPDSWVRCNEGDNTWSAFDIVGHLVFAERTDWMPRIRMILEKGDAQAFDPFDRFAHLNGDQDQSMERRLDDFAVLRGESLATLKGLDLQQEDLLKRGRHPALGAVTLAELLATWAVHDLNHLHQVSRVMAHRYRDAVGPWNAYLGVLQCAGHGAP